VAGLSRHLSEWGKYEFNVSALCLGTYSGLGCGTISLLKTFYYQKKEENKIVYGLCFRLKR